MPTLLGDSFVCFVTLRNPQKQRKGANRKRRKTESLGGPAEQQDKESTPAGDADDDEDEQSS